MPRDSGGNYTLPAGNPVVSGTTILATWANDTMPDLAAAMTDSLSRTGSGGMLVPLRVNDGTVLLPGYAFNTEVSLGIYRKGVALLGIAGGGEDTALFDGTTGDVMVRSQVKALAAVPIADEDLTRKDYVDPLVMGARYPGFLIDGTHAAAPETDLDLIIVNSFYLLGAGLTNTPTDYAIADSGWLETAMYSTVSAGIQTIHGRDGLNANKIWRRSMAADVWGAWELIVGQPPTRQVITVSDPAWVPPVSAKTCKVYITAGGGGGGGADGQGSGTANVGAGGGAGGTGIIMLTAPFEASYAIVIGAGGAGGAGTGGAKGDAGEVSSFIGGAINVVVSAGGGGDGMATTGQGRAFGGSGNKGSGGDQDLRGCAGVDAFAVNNEVAATGHGGASFWGGNGRARNGDSGTGGVDGGGGGGGYSLNETNNRGGGDGGAGLCVVEISY